MSLVPRYVNKHVGTCLHPEEDEAFIFFDTPEEIYDVRNIPGLVPKDGYGILRVLDY